MSPSPAAEGLGDQADTSEHPVLTPVEPLRFHALTYLEDRGEVTVGRLDEGSFVVLPPDGAALLHQLEDGLSCQQAARWYASTYGEELDVADFVADLDALGFLRHDSGPYAPPPPVRWQRLGQAVFSRVAGALYIALLVCAGAAMWRHHAVQPRPQNFFFIHYMSVLVLAVFVGQVPLILLHESAHALAGRRLGLRSTLSIGRRLHYVVFQTTMDGLVSVPPRKRLLPILAGMLTDLGVLCVLTLIATALQRSDGSFGLAARYCLALAFLTLLRLAWQLWFFLQTDVYFLVVTVLGCVDLQTTAKQVLRNRIDRRLGRRPTYDPQLWHPRDRAVARWYSVLIAAGYGFMLLSLVAFVLPMVGRLVTTVVARLLGNGDHGSAGLLDSILMLLFTLGELSVAGLMAYRQYRRPSIAAASAELSAPSGSASPAPSASLGALHVTTDV
jgi:hypothetical protein